MSNSLLFVVMMSAIRGGTLGLNASAVGASMTTAIPIPDHSQAEGSGLSASADGSGNAIIRKIQRIAAIHPGDFLADVELGGTADEADTEQSVTMARILCCKL